MLALPGAYTVKLTVNGRTLMHPLTLKMDPRASITPLGLQQQFTLGRRIARMMDRTFAAIERLKAAAPATAAAGEPPGDSRIATLEALNGDLATAYDVVEGTDRAPTVQATRAVAALDARVRKLVP